MLNFTFYNSGSAVKTADMNISNLDVGQKLIRVIRPRFGTGHTTTAEYIIKKILKTRLVLEAVEEVNGKKHEIRLLVENSKWAYETGKVTTTREGDSESYSRTSYDFATENDKPIVDTLVKASLAEMARREIKDQATISIRKISSTMHADLESIEAAIVALQALAAQMKKNA